MPTTRRDFIRTSGTAVLGASALSAMQTSPAYAADDNTAAAAGPDKPTLVVIYMRGGSDPLHAIVPYGDKTYYDVRPTIAIPPRDTPQAKGVIPLNKYFGMNPAMAPLHALYKQGLVAPLLNVGSTHPTRSHFDAQDFMERAAPGVKSVSEGWLNRYLYLTRSPNDADLRGSVG